MQIAIPYMQLRGGSSKGLFFKASDLPADEAERNKIIIAAMEGVGHGDPRQIDGLGGATPLTSKVAIISLSESKEADLDYLFLQVVVGKGQVSDTQNCGNILAGVVPFALESGMIKANDTTTTVRVHMVNTGSICEIIVETPGGQVNYAGTTKIDGVKGSAAPIICNYEGIAGSTCGSLLPTGNIKDIVNGVAVTCIDNGMPVVLLRSVDLGISGYESPSELNANELLKNKLESIRLAIGEKMNLGNVKDKTVPKMCIISPPLQGGTINTRTFLPQVCHEAIGVLGAISVGTACLLKGSITDGMAKINNENTLSIEHPSGEFTIHLNITVTENKITVHKAGVIRTARLLSKGHVFIPEII